MTAILTSAIPQCILFEQIECICLFKQCSCHFLLVILFSLAAPRLHPVKTGSMALMKEKPRESPRDPPTVAMLLPINNAIASACTQHYNIVRNDSLSDHALFLHCPALFLYISDLRNGALQSGTKLASQGQSFHLLISLGTLKCLSMHMQFWASPPLGWPGNQAV